MCKAFCNAVVFTGCATVRSRSNGFTLLEVLVAISIFSVMALGSFRLLNITAEIADAGQMATEKTGAYKRAISVITSDLRSSINRPLRSSIADKPDLAAFLTHSTFMLEFSRGAYGPSGGATRSNALRVRYLLRDAQQLDSQSVEPVSGFELIRQLSPMDGQQQGVEREQLLLKNVETATIRFMDNSGVWHSQWPVADIITGQVGRDGEQQAIADEDAIPRAVELDIRSSISSGPTLVVIRS
ncbi:MAG: type II secretion system minor pseudopilin GspJ [Pseudomonadota bacterium]